MYVSISAYNDGDLLDGCLESVQEHLPDADVCVVDGRYETWPDGADNSTDDTASVCLLHDVDYDPAGPFPRESDKHEYRVAQAPDDERVLFLDADERLLDVDLDALDDMNQVAYQPRIFNALVYGPKCVYWPRSFYPETVTSINRWDAYLFDVPCEKTDAITILHRHDLRERDYREKKYARFAEEGRAGRYDDAFETYLHDDWDVEFHECPKCGLESLTRSQITADGTHYSWAEACIRDESCYAATREYELNGWEYLPNDWRHGLDEAPRRLRAELLDAGCPFVATAPLQQLAPAIGLWVDENLRDVEKADEERVFAR